VVRAQVRARALSKLRVVKDRLLGRPSTGGEAEDDRAREELYSEGSPFGLPTG
jgi:hypothetical protein